MKAVLIFVFSYLVFTAPIFGQKVVFDSRHFTAVSENTAVRLAAENTHNNYLGTIHQRLDDINVNVSSVILVQDIIRSSLTEVNQALKTGMMIRQVYTLSEEIISSSNETIAIAQADPYLLLFAEDVARQMKSRGLNLVTEVSDFVLKEGSNVLMDYSKRDLLLKKIILELQVMRAMVFSMSRSMYWAKLNGVLKSANPFQGFINQDTRQADDILFKIKILKN